MPLEYIELVSCTQLAAFWNYYQIPTRRLIKHTEGQNRKEPVIAWHGINYIRHK